MAGPRKVAIDRGISTRATRSTTKSNDPIATDEQSNSPLKETVKPRRQVAVVVEVAVKADNSIIVASTKTDMQDAGNKTGSVAAQDGDGHAVVEQLHDKENVPPAIRSTRAERQSRRKPSSDAPRKIESVPEVPTPPANAQGDDNSQQAHERSATAVVEESTETKLELHAVESTDHKNSGKKRKWSRPTRVVKLEDENNGNVEACSDTESEDDKGEGRMDSDGEYGVRKRPTNGSSEPKRVKADRNQEQGLSEYERLRLENIRRNQEMLQFLQLPSVTNEIQMAIIEGKPVDAVASGEKTDGTPAPVRMKRQSVKKAPKIVQPVRTSNRIRGVAVTPLEIGENDMLDPESRSQTQAGSNRTTTKTESDDEGSDHDDEDPANLMSGDLFFDKETRDSAIRVDGHYKGWLNSEVMDKYGFEKSAEDAWEANGGGTFSFSDPSGSSTAGSSKKSARRPKHDAKMVAKAMFKKNPNSFFYRHNEPGQEQWTGDWTEPERDLFLQVARTHGCGDKWGLFASHIPHRVGYQCSNFYRQVVLPEGLVFDPNYEYTSRGKPIYCGKYNQRRN
ncbi:hypothetical protein KVV02_007770 [Mortierella alpina]|uniref:Myb-like domain-containing protein n=1 Tax=Mortierella alpina TaxID=64518 RepID=A0A9P8A6L6_MORAP|nr:hypothetical protein KVV02_007770 [Mortierella alpina]